MSPEQLDEARAKEADRLWGEAESRVGELSALQVAARLARENWTPPEPAADPDVWAFLEWWGSEDGNADPKHAYLAGARMAREQERERAKVLLEFAEDIAKFSLNYGVRANRALAKYRGET